MAKRKALPAITDYQAEIFKDVLSKVPAGSINAGSWKVYRETPGRNGGVMDSYLGKMEYDAEADLEEQISNGFSPQYGGGIYKLRFYDAERRRVEQIPPVHIAIPGDPRVNGSSAGSSVPDSQIDAIEQEKKKGALLQVQSSNLWLQKQIDKLDKPNNGDGDPFRGVMADLLKSKLKGEGEKGNSPRELLELAMVMKAIREEPEKKSESKGETTTEKAVGAVMTAVTGLVTTATTMQQTMMQSMQGLMTQQMDVMRMSSGVAQDPWTAFVSGLPDLIDRVGSHGLSIVREVKDGYVEAAGADAGAALEQAGSGGRSLPAPRQKGNEFLVVVYQNFRKRVPPDITAEQVQYYLTEKQLQGILQATPAQVVEVLEREGLKKFFEKDPAIRVYVTEVVAALQKLYQEAAEKGDDDKGGDPK